MIHPTRHERMEWARMAQAAYKQHRNDIGHRYSAAASLPDAQALEVTRFDYLQNGYRQWLVFGNLPEA